jgi:hypothetical protein
MRRFLTAVAALLMAAPAAADDADLYRAAATLTPGDPGRAALSVTVADGWKWNAEFPFKLAVESQEGATLARTAFGKDDVKVADGGKTATVDLGAAGKVGPASRVRGKVTFSVCNEKVCRFFRNLSVEWKP